MSIVAMYYPLAEGLIVDSSSTEDVERVYAEPPVRNLLDNLRRHHEESFDHSLRVATFSADIVGSYGVDDISVLIRSALLHDIGKLGVSRGVLEKQGPLTNQDWEEIGMHPAGSFTRLNALGYLREAAISVRHHEFKPNPYPRSQTDRRADGRGEDRRSPLSEEDQKSAEILTVADTLDGLLFPRSYAVGKWMRTDVPGIFRTSLHRAPNAVRSELVQIALSRL